MHIPTPSPERTVIFFLLIQSAVSTISTPHIFTDIRSFTSVPRLSPLMVMRVPGGPSFGETPIMKIIKLVCSLRNSLWHFSHQIMIITKLTRP